MDIEVRVRLTDKQLQRWFRLAVRSNLVGQMYTRPLHAKGGVASLASETGQLLARDLDWEDAAFFLEARQAVMSLAEEVQERRDYQAYVEECLARVQTVITNGMARKWLPVSFEQWKSLRKVDQE